MGDPEGCQESAQVRRITDNERIEIVSAYVNMCYESELFPWFLAVLNQIRLYSPRTRG